MGPDFSDVLRLSPQTLLVPVIHGSGDCAVEVRRILLRESFDCVAVPLPPSFQELVEQGIHLLPRPTLAVQSPPVQFRTEWSPGSDASAGFGEEAEYGADQDEEIDEEDDEDFDEPWSYVPIDPCQPVIAALRIAMGEHVAREFIDLETTHFQPYSEILPDPYALKQVSLERFASAILPSLLPLPEGQPRRRVARMGARLRELEQRYRSIACICSVVDWPWIRTAYQSLPMFPEDEPVAEPVLYQPDPKTLLFLLGELPFITGLYEQAPELGDDENLSIDGVKELLLAARTSYRNEMGNRGRKITPHILRVMLKYIRNLSLIERRFTPDLYTMVMAAKQVAGDSFALHIAETARAYPFVDDLQLPVMRMGIEQGRLPTGDIVSLANRLPGPPLTWRSCQLKPRPEQHEQQKWKMQWDPFSQCSYPPEDDRVENFRAHLFERARMVMGADLARTEKFTTSIKDGIDIRDTLRHWYSGDIYVKVLPPARGDLDCAVMLFDSPADPRQYPWRSTWFAEHANESTLAFFATDYRQELIGPGIGVSTYGGALFLYPPRWVRDIWNDPLLDFTETLEERLLAAACLHSRHRQIVLLSSLPPGAAWRRLAKRFGKHWVHLPLSQFSDATVQQLRIMHVLNDKSVRSYAAKYIRRS